MGPRRKRMPNVPSKKSKTPDMGMAINKRRRWESGGSVDDTSDPVSWYLFPSYTIHVLLFVVFVSRFSVVSNKENWWILHPNEVLHSLEVAHSEVYGYGFGSESYLPLSEAPDAQHEILYSIRSWIYPKFFILCLLVKEFLNISTAPFQFMKNIHTLVASFLPVAVFFLLRNLQRGRRSWSDVAIMAAIFVGFNDYCVLLGTRTLDSGFLGPFTFLSYAIFVSSETPCEETKHKTMVDNNYNTLVEENLSSLVENGVQRKTRLKIHHLSRYVFSGFIAGLSCYIRPDTVIEVVVFHLTILPYYWKKSDHVWQRYLLTSVGLVFAFLLGGLDDLASYGQWFLSFRRWITFHYWHAASVYGTKDIFFYVNSVFTSFFTIFFLVVVVLVVAVNVTLLCARFLWKYKPNHQWLVENGDLLNLTSRLFVAALILFFAYGVFPYKELHFIHTAVVLFLCSAACAICSTYHLLRLSLIGEGLSRITPSLKMLVYSEVLMLTILSFNAQTSPLSIHTSAEVNQCFYYLSRQSDVKGLLVDYPVHWTGAYSLLHQDIPIIGKVQYDFREWDKSRRLNLKSTFRYRENVSLALPERISNYVTERNGLLVLQIVAKNTDYNYVILTRNRKFPKSVFTEVLKVGSTTVLKKIRSRDAEKELRDIAEAVDKQKRNATIYEYEAGWLLRFNLPEVAVARLETALSSDVHCVGCWQLLNAATKVLFGATESQRIKQRCYEVIGRDRCNGVTKGANIYPEYYFGFRPVLPVPFEKSLT